MNLGKYVRLLPLVHLVVSALFGPSLHADALSGEVLRSSVDRLVFAHYAEANLTHDVTVSTVPSFLPEIPGAGTYANGDSITISAPVVQTDGLNRYTFARWLQNGILFTTNASFTKTFDTTDATTLNYAAVYNTQSIRPVVIAATANIPNPVRATNGFVVTIQFDRSMNPAVTPLLIFVNPAITVQAQVPNGGIWSTTTLSNDTYRTPPITFTPGMDGTHQLYASQAQALDGAELAFAGVLTVEVDTVPPVTRSIGAAPGSYFAVVSWITDEPSTSQVEYGPDTNYGSATDVEGGLVTLHTVPLSGLIPGTSYHFRVRSIDQAGNEGVSLDRTFSIPSAPDLIVTNITVLPATIRSGAELTISWADRNIGLGPTMTSWDDLLVISNATTGLRLYSSTVHDDASANGNISPEASRVRQSTFRLPDGPSAVGTLLITIASDASNSVFEYNALGTGESNNAASITRDSIIAEYPDLAVSDVTVQPAGLPGQPVQVSWVVTNQGSAAAVSPWTDTLFLSTDRVIGNDQAVTNFIQSVTLGPGQSILRTQAVILPEDIFGNRFIVVNVDSGSDVFETIETNNTGISATPVQLRTPLRILRVENGITLEWFSDCTNCILEETSELGPNTVWSTTAAQPRLEGGRFQVTIPSPNGDRFYRLRNP